MLVFVKLTKGQKQTLKADCKTIYRNLDSKSLTEYKNRAIDLIKALSESHGLDYSEQRELLADLENTYSESLKFAKLNDELRG